jgi:homocysteine S-methyltransferase
VNGECVRFLSRIRDKYGDYGGHVYVGGLMGCQGDAYQPNQALSEPVAAACHRFQAHALALAGVDFLMGSTLPALSEALGMAAAMGETGTPYVLSFVVRPSGELLDGTPLHQAIARIDAAVPAPPVGYMVNCVHPRVFRAAVSCQLAQAPASADRLMGLQANTSARPPEGLDELPYLDGDSPEALCEAMIGLYTDLGIRVLGGCCGTDERYLACLAGGVSRLLPASPSSFSG